MRKSKLFLIVEEKDKWDKQTFRRLDTEEIIPKERMHPVKQPPIIMHFDFSYALVLPPYIEKIRGFKEKANALLVGGILAKGEDAYCPMSYYFISKI